MTENTDAMIHAESELLQVESELACGRDRRLAGELDRPQPVGASSAGGLRELSDRPRLSAGAERRLVAAA
jgi:hypothetical protein